MYHFDNPVTGELILHNRLPAVYNWTIYFRHNRWNSVKASLNSASLYNQDKTIEI